MNLFAVSGILIGLSSAAMALLVFIIGRKGLHYVWGLFCISVAFWGFGGYMIATITTNIHTVDLIWRITYIGVTFIPILFTHFVHEFLRIRRKVLLVFFYLLGAFFLLLAFSGKLLLADTRFVFDQFYYSMAGPLHPLYLVFWFGLVLYAHILLWRSYRHADGLKKTQIKYFFAAMLVSFSGGSLSYLPAYGIDVYPTPNLLAFLYTIIVTYAIFKKQLFNIKVVAAELFVVGIAILLLINLLSSNDQGELLYNLVLFVLVALMGVLLIRSFRKEVRYHAQQAAYQELRKLDAAKSEFITIASHQFRTPLSAIKGYLSMLLEGFYEKNPHEQKKALQNIATANERLIGLTDSLLNVSRMQAGKIELRKERVRLEGLVEHLVHLYLPKAQLKNLELVFLKPKGAVPLVSIDREKIRTVIEGMIDNALRYTQKGAITISLKAQGSSIKNRGVLMSITDTGKGLTKEECETVFRSFTRGKTAQSLWTEGVGLSLYIAKQFVEAHGGRIWAESPGPGQGSTFSVELPLA